MFKPLPVASKKMMAHWQMDLSETNFVKFGKKTTKIFEEHVLESSACNMSTV